MGCRCNERRQQLTAAAKAVQTGRVDIARAEVKAAGRSLTEDAKAFADGLRARLGRR